MGQSGHSMGAGDAGDERFIDRLYEAAAVPERWQSVLQSFMRLAGGEHGILVAQREGFNRYVGSSPECEALVRAHFELFPTNERTRRLLAARHPGFVTDRDVLTEEEMANEPVYREFWFRRGYGNGVATAIFVPSGDTLIVHAECLRASGPVPRSVVSRLDRLRPHFARAALLSSRLEMERVQATATALQLIGLPAAVLGRNGRVLAVNAALAGLMPDVLQDRRSRVALSDPRADRLLDTAITHLGHAPHEAAIRSIPIKARDGRPPLIVHLVPIRGAAHDVFAGASAVLVVTAVVPKAVPGADVVQGLFDLAPAEAKLAALVASGHQPREAAVRLGITEETARTTLKRVLVKTGTARQAELVGLLQGKAIEPRQ
jgi:DNA-binding CsgD family transcriptional regulator